MSDTEPEYRRRIRQKAEQRQRESDREQDEAAKNSGIEKIAVALNGFGEKIDRQSDENTPAKRGERRWRKAEVIGLWFAGGVALIAIGAASHYSNKQYAAMIESTAYANRAWISVTTPGIHFFADNVTAGLAVNVENIGVQPGLDISSFIEPFAYKPIGGGPKKILSFERFEPNKSCEKKALSEVGALWPKQQPLVRASADETIRVDRVAEVNGSIWYGVRGCIHYNTMGKPHVTAFCYVQLPPVHSPRGNWDWTICTGVGQQYAD